MGREVYLLRSRVLGREVYLLRSRVLGREVYLLRSRVLGLTPCGSSLRRYTSLLFGACGAEEICCYPSRRLSALRRYTSLLFGACGAEEICCYPSRRLSALRRYSFWAPKQAFRLTSKKYRNKLFRYFFKRAYISG